MKKLFAIIALVGLAFNAFAATEYDASFLNCKTVTCTNDTLCVSNLVSFSAANSVISAADESCITNLVGVVFTNYQGRQVIVTATHSTSENLLGEVDLPYIGVQAVRTNSTGTADSLDPIYAGVGIFIRSRAGADNTTASQIVFEPVPDGEYGCPGVAEANCLVVSITPTGATEVRTFVPLDFANDCNGLLMGCKKLRLRRVTSLDVAGNARRWDILECKLVGFAP